MKQTRYSPKYIMLSLLAVIAGGLAVGCVATPPPTPAPRVRPTDVQVAVVPDPTPTTPAVPAPAPVLLEPDDSCVTCHTDQDMLIATGDEEEVGEELSEGEG